MTGVALEDGWYAVRDLDADTFAIGEPLYEQRNWSYLIRGAERALLFDTGSYYGEIAPVVARRWSGPLVVLPSHMHYDHLGNVGRFDHVALPELPVLRACEARGAPGGRVTPTDALFLGEDEGREPPEFAVAEWLAVGSEIDLGGRVLRLLHTPGHSPDSVSLWEPGRDRLYAADFLYPGQLYAQTPGASLVDYLLAARAVAELIGPATRILGAHGLEGPPDAPPLPELAPADLAALIVRLEAVLAEPPALDGGETVTLPVSAALELIVGPGAL